MQTANIYLKIDDKNDVPIEGVTPAEALLLGLDHFKRAKAYPVTQIVVTQERTVDEIAVAQGEDGKQVINYVPRTIAAECRRLRAKYGKKRFQDAFGEGIRPNLPESFAEAEELVTGKEAEQAEDEGTKTAELFGSREEAEAIIKAEEESLAKELNQKHSDD